MVEKNEMDFLNDKNRYGAYVNGTNNALVWTQ